MGLQYKRGDRLEKLFDQFAIDPDKQPEPRSTKKTEQAQNQTKSSSQKSKS